MKRGIYIILFLLITSLRLSAYNRPILHNGRSDSQSGGIVATLGEPRGARELC